jgi:hypothetical protein
MDLIIDVVGTVVGAGEPSGSLAVTFGFAGLTGGQGALGGTAQIDPVVTHTFEGVGSLAASPVSVFNLSGLTRGSATVVELPIPGVEGIATGSGDASVVISRGIVIGGYAIGSSSAVLSEPEPVYGLAVVTGFMEVICVPYSICRTPLVKQSFRWGHQFGMGDLTICVTGKGGNPVGPVCISYTLYQIQQGCQPKQVGPSGRKPGNSSLGCYYATGTAGECGQPGLWVIRWNYQISFGASPIEKDCYFYVFDSVLCPVPGDTLPRTCKYGWD